jgi:hypothetical protein
MELAEGVKFLEKYAELEPIGSAIWRKGSAVLRGPAVRPGNRKCQNRQEFPILAILFPAFFSIIARFPQRNLMFYQKLHDFEGFSQFFASSLAGLAYKH